MMLGSFTDESAADLSLCCLRVKTSAMKNAGIDPTKAIGMEASREAYPQSFMSPAKMVPDVIPPKQHSGAKRMSRVMIAVTMDMQAVEAMSTIPVGGFNWFRVSAK